MSRMAPSRGLRRASLDHVTSAQSDPQPVQHSSVPLRPASAFAGSRISRPLSYIVEGSQSTSEDEEEEPGLNASAAEKGRPLLCRRQSDTSICHLPPSAVPDRSSSKSRFRVRNSRQYRDLPNMPPPPSQGPGQTTSVRGRGTSPIRHVIERSNPVSSNVQQLPPRTFVRSVRPTDILDVPDLSHSRVSLKMHIPAPLFVGGGSVEGQVCVVINDGKTRNRQRSNPALSIGRISIDVLGVETSHGKNFIFRSLATELLDKTHPPPATMAAASRAVSDAFWEVMPSVSILPFRLELPVHVGPPPYSSKIASIKYILCSTVSIRISGEQQYVRKSQEIHIITVHDPEKALVNLPNPLTAHDELFFSFGVQDVIKLTAGVHRQTWLSGTAIFVDIHVSNHSSKAVKRIDFQLEEVITFYHHAAASTRVEAATHLRIPDRSTKALAAKGNIKKARHGWQGIRSQSHEGWTSRLDVPSGLVTIDEVSNLYQLVFATAKTFRTENSLDIPPNSITQVAIAIENRRTNSRSRGQSGSDAKTHLTQEAIVPEEPTQYHPSRAFSAARRQSLEQLRQMSLDGEIEDLGKVLAESSRKLDVRHAERTGQDADRIAPPTTVEEIDKESQSRRKAKNIDERKTIRLMRSTSGIGFSSPSSSDESDHLAPALECFIADNQRWRGLRAKEETKVGKELRVARKRSGILGALGTWRNVATEQASQQTGP